MDLRCRPCDGQQASVRLEAQARITEVLPRQAGQQLQRPVRRVDTTRPSTNSPLPSRVVTSIGAMPFRPATLMP
jgi:hypothetical protein